MPALFAALVAVTVTVAIERLGGVVGGFLATLPTTIVPASLGFWASSPPEVARDALAAAPAGMLLNAGFLWLWRVLPPRMPAGPQAARLAGLVVLTLAAWGCGAVLLVSCTQALASVGVPSLAVGTCCTGVLLGAGVLACLTAVPAPRARRPAGLGALVARGLLAGTAIAVAVAVSRSGNGLLAGVASTFPAIFLTAMVSLGWSHGDAVPAGAVGPMMLGSTSVATYALGAAVVLPASGPALGVTLPWAVAALGVTLPATLWLRARQGRPINGSPGDRSG